MPYILALILIDIVILLTNYTPHTWLVGWDNVMPELNLTLNFKRALFALWQDYRGLGLVDGMAHTANLMHTFYIAALSALFPANMLRYVFIVFTHLMGGIGMYWLIRKLTKQKIAAFLGALLYMFNIGVIQMYFAPLEVFAMHFTALPLITLTLLNVLEKPCYNRLGLFFLTCFLMTPQSFVPTVFIAFCVLFGFIIVSDFIFKRDLKKISLITALFFIANAFWLLPYVYSVKYSAPEIPKTRINQYSSEEIFYRNKEYGNLSSVLMLKGFMLSTPEVDVKTNQYVPFLGVWEQHTKKPLYIFTYSLIFLIGIAGIFKSMLDRKREFLPFALSWFVALFFLANDTAILEILNIWVRAAFPLIGEAFRFPFTKFITLFAFCFSLFFAYGIYFIISLVSFKKIWHYLVLAFGSMAILYLAFPALNGQFFSPLLRLKIPNDYFQTIEYFNNIEDDKRIAMLPAETFWNWEYRSWGHRGSGFLWYGLAQPLLMRPFDPWSTQNEQFYNELHYSMQRKDRNMFDDVLKKYSVEYVVLDKSVVNAGKPKAIDYEKMSSFLNNSVIARQVQSYDLIDIYYIDILPVTEDISILKNPPHINPLATFTYEDTAFRTYGSYITNTSNPEAIYPFTAMFTEKTQEDLEIDVKIDDDSITIRPKAALLQQDSGTAQEYYLDIPPTTKDALVPVRVELLSNKIVFTTINPQIIIGNTTYELPEYSQEVALNTVFSPTSIEFTESGQVAQMSDSAFLLRDFPNTIKAVRGNDSELLTVDASPFFLEGIQIPVTITGSDTIQIKIAKVASAGSIEQPIAKREFSIVDKKYLPVDDTVIYVTSDKTNTEVVMWNENMLHSSGYIMTVSSSWNFGLPLSFYVDNPFEKRAEIDTLLSKGSSVINTLILPPIDPYHRGYGMHFIAKTMGNTTSETVIHDFNAYPIPFHFLREIQLKKTVNIPRKTVHTAPYEASRINPYLYSVSVDSRLGDYIYLDQLFQQGWKAQYGCRFGFIGCQELEHVQINNWANGWKLPEATELTTDNLQPTTYTILFWPQYLEYIGLGLLFLTMLVLLRKSYTPENRMYVIHAWNMSLDNIQTTLKKALSLLKEEV